MTVRLHGSDNEIVARSGRQRVSLLIEELANLPFDLGRYA